MLSINNAQDTFINKYLFIRRGIMRIQTQTLYIINGFANLHYNAELWINLKIEIEL
jgi:hypothetical protein